MATKTKPPKDTEAPEVRRELFGESLKVQLTAVEIADRADRAAQMISDRDNKEEELKAATKHAKSVIEGLDAEFRRLSCEVRTRSTYRAVQCERVYLYREDLLRETRLDTGEVLRERRLTDSERQRELPFAAPPKEEGNGEQDDF